MSEEDKNKSSKGITRYTTTFNIPVWISHALKNAAEERNLRGMNSMLEVILTDYFTRVERRKEHNEKVKELRERESITEQEKELLWWT